MFSVSQSSDALIVVLEKELEEQLYSVKEVAERNGLSAKTIQRVIRDNPEIGVVMKPRTKTLLTFTQAAQISSIIKSNRSQIAENSDKVVRTEPNSKIEKSQVAETAADSAKIAELEAQILALTERAAKAEGRVEVLQSQVNDLKEQRDTAIEERKVLLSDLTGTRKLLEDSEAKAQRAEDEANRFTKSFFGFYRKK